MLLGAHLTLMMGPMLAVPVPLPLAEALVGVEVTHTDQGRSGFQLQFQVGRSGPLDLVDFPLLANPLLKPFTRVVVVVRFGLLPEVLIDGVITQISLTPSDEPGASTLTATGEDVSVMMDLIQLKMPYPAMNEGAIAAVVIARYAAYGLVPAVVPPFMIDVPVPTRRIPQQNGTDLEFLRTLAQRYSYVFYVEPTAVPMVNKAYWGPPVHAGIPQPALSVNMGPATNVASITFSYNALSPTMIVDLQQDPDTNVTTPVVAPPVSIQPPLALLPAAAANLGRVRTSLLSTTRESVKGVMSSEHLTRPEAEAAIGLSMLQAQVRSQATVQASLDHTVSATGELDALRYGSLLKARGIVGVRGAGFTHDGNWYVQSVTHTIRKGEYRQRFALSREGVGSLLPLVRP